MASGIINTAADFWAKVDKAGPNGCWLWTGTKVRLGYGQFRMRNKRWQTHRLAYVLTYGPVPADKFVCHKCDNPTCCNPDHMFVGTPADNMIDKMNKGRAPHGELNKMSRYTTAQVLEIRRLAAAGISERKIREVLGIGRGSVAQIIAGNTWRHLLPNKGVDNG
jgi:hypothetical protein